MENVTVEKMTYVLSELSKIKKPSKCIIAAKAKLEDHICRAIESLRAVGPLSE